MSWHIIWTLLLLVIFVGIVMWAFSSRRKTDFDEAARLPLEDDPVVTKSAQPRDSGEPK